MGCLEVPEEIRLVGWWVLLPITLSLPILVEVEFGCDDTGHSVPYAIPKSRANNYLKTKSFYTTSYIKGNHWLK